MLALGRLLFVLLVLLAARVLRGIRRKQPVLDIVRAEPERVFIIAIPVLHPLTYITTHIVETQGIRSFCPYDMRGSITVFTSPSHLIQPVAT